ncbi:MAG: phosphotransferase family protein [Deltaproteobacteria bacterium]|nr:phosphotransferase family protein [Deltaproteobacteria bacterium]
MNTTDEAVSARKGEELDIGELKTFLKDSLPSMKGDVSLKQFPGGHSNLTYLVRIGEEELILRRPPIGRKAKTAHDMNREYRILNALRDVFPWCPTPLVYSDDESIMGCPFYLMERIKGMVIRKKLPDGVTFSPDQARALNENMIDVHVRLHSVDYKKIGLGNFGKPDGYVKRQVEGWSERYRQARTPDAPDCEDIMTWIHENMPSDSGRAAIIHNDFKLDNMVVDVDDPTRIVGVLDWEMSTIGDPIMDIGNILAYQVEETDPPDLKMMRFMPEPIEFALTRKERVDLYEKKSGLSFHDINFYYCFGLFRLAVIAQQIYYRYYHGQTSDKRFEMMVVGVQILERAAKRTIEQGFK